MLAREILKKIETKKTYSIFNVLFAQGVFLWIFVFFWCVGVNLNSAIVLGIVCRRSFLVRLSSGFLGWGAIVCLLELFCFGLCFEIGLYEGLATTLDNARFLDNRGWQFSFLVNLWKDKKNIRKKYYFYFLCEEVSHTLFQPSISLAVH